MDTRFNKGYWDARYAGGHTGWDAGAVTIPLKEYFDQLGDKRISILVPGAGNAHEAAYLYEQGFQAVHILDISEVAIARFRQQHVMFPAGQVHQGDFWEHHGAYDLIVEQTFFCAIDVALRVKYVEKVHELLNPGGLLVGLLWNHPMGKEDPPFGGTMDEYERLFSPFFRIEIMETAYNSIGPRAGREVFIKMRKK